MRYETTTETDSGDDKRPLRYETDEDDGGKVVKDETTSETVIIYADGENPLDTVSAEEYFNPGDINEDELEYLPDEALEDLSQIFEAYLNEYEGMIDGDLGYTKRFLLKEIIRYLHTPYQYGGNTKSGIDCSAFTKSCYWEAATIELNRSARDQYAQGERISKSDLQFGDLVFFDTQRRKKPGHVGIFIGNNLFAHASSSKGVILSSLENSYYKKRYMGARRFDELND